MDTKKKKMMRNFSFPLELITQILLRLPVKSLVRFRLVSKPWSSLILDTPFVKLHFDLAAAPSNRLIYMKPHDSEARLIDVDTSIHQDCALIQPPIPHNFHIKSMKSCRGFILLASYNRLILWNPSTGAHKPLSYSLVASNILRDYAYETHPTFWWGIGYERTNDDYLIVIAWVEECETPELNVEFFSLRTDTWKQIEGTECPYLLSTDEFKTGVFFNGAIHWLVANYNHDEASGDDEQVIIAFDLAEKDYSEIFLPEDITSGSFRDLKVLEGCLSICHFTRDYNFEIRVMREYNVRSSWTKLDIVIPYTIGNRCYAPLSFTKSGGLVATNEDGQLAKYDVEGKLVEHNLGPRYIHTMTMFTDTLLSLPGDFEEAGEDGH